MEKKKKEKKKRNHLGKFHHNLGVAKGFQTMTKNTTSMKE